MPFLRVLLFDCYGVRLPDVTITMKLTEMLIDADRELFPGSEFIEAAAEAAVELRLPQR